ncbi:MAG TPA: GTPase ObgE [Chthoniobacteraceae bacterium]|nr:GTPase ObgE [Chthoniobacteraceae bacterium]
MFVDQIKIYAKAGNGGDGSCSFRRAKFVPKGGPDGGDGGRGGSIILRADPHIDTLSPFLFEPIIRAKNGEGGRGKQCYGKGAKDKIVKVPIGTLIHRLPEGVNPFAPKMQEWELEGDEEAMAQEAIRTREINPGELELLADLSREGDEYRLCKGGKGGKGNLHFKSATNQAPKEFTPGEKGEEGYFLFELRSIAEAGLVGYPNAGKSTLLGQLSAARPKVAAYPFTTLHPMIGIVDFGGFRKAPIADIPGLIEGAHQNIGLGHEFLRHIMRCRVLLFVVDLSGNDERDPIEDLASLRKELKLYNEELSTRPWLVAANKMDDPRAVENLGPFRQRFPRVGIIPISAGLGEGIDELKAALEVHLFPDEPESQPAGTAADAPQENI